MTGSPLLKYTFWGEGVANRHTGELIARSISFHSPQLIAHGHEQNMLEGVTQMDNIRNARTVAHQKRHVPMINLRFYTFRLMLYFSRML